MVGRRWGYVTRRRQGGVREEEDLKDQRTQLRAEAQLKGLTRRDLFGGGKAE